MKTLIEAMQKFDSKYGQEKREYDAAIKKLEANYNKDGEVYKDLAGKLKGEFDAKINEARTELNGIFENSFTSMKKQLMDYVNKPVSEDLVKNMQVLNLSGAKLTDKEAEVMLSEYGGAYMAKKAIYNSLEKESLFAAHFKPFNEVMDEINENEESVKAWIGNYNPESYTHYILVDEKNSPLMELNATVSNYTK